MADAAARHASRLAAGQALYQMELTGADGEDVAAEFLAHRFGGDTGPVSEPDAEFFESILKGVPQHQVEIDRSVAKCLSTNWKLERIDSILRAILRAAAFEM